MLTTCVGEVAREKGVSATELARLAGISRPTAYSLYRGGVARIDLDTLARIARALQVSAFELLREVPDNEKRPAA